MGVLWEMENYQVLLDLPVGDQPRDYFLADIAALAKIYRPDSPRLQRVIGISHLPSVAGNRPLYP